MRFSQHEVGFNPFDGGKAYDTIYAQNNSMMVHLHSQKDGFWKYKTISGKSEKEQSILFHINNTNILSNLNLSRKLQNQILIKTARYDPF